MTLREISIALDNINNRTGNHYQMLAALQGVKLTLPGSNKKPESGVEFTKEQDRVAELAIKQAQERVQRQKKGGR